MVVTRWLLALAMSIAVCSRLHAQAEEASGSAPEPSPTSEAERLFREGRAHMAERRPRLACPAFARSYALTPALGTLLNLALCEAELGHLVEGSSRVEQFLREAGEEDPRRALAEERLRTMRARVARISFRAAQRPPEDGVVLLDGDPVANLSPDTAQTLDPGVHHLEVRVGDTPLAEYDLRLSAGEALVVTLPWPDEQGAKDSTASPSPVAIGASVAQEPRSVARRTSGTSEDGAGGHSRRSRRKRTTVAVAIVAGISLVVAAISGGIALRQARIVRRECDPHDECSQQGIDAARTGRWAAPLSSAGFVVGAAAATTSFSLWMSARRTNTDAAAVVGAQARF